MQNTVPVSNFPAESGYLSEVCVISDLLLVALKEVGLVLLVLVLLCFENYLLRTKSQTY